MYSNWGEINGILLMFIRLNFFIPLIYAVMSTLARANYKTCHVGVVAPASLHALWHPDLTFTPYQHNTYIRLG